MRYKQVCRAKPTQQQFEQQAEERMRQAERNRIIAEQQREAVRKKEEEEQAQKESDVALGKHLKAISEQQLRLQALQLQSSETSASSEPIAGPSRLDISQDSINTSDDSLDHDRTFDGPLRPPTPSLENFSTRTPSVSPSHSSSEVSTANHHCF